MGTSGRKGPEWVDELIREKPEFAKKFWDAILTADRSIWQRRKYGRERWRSVPRHQGRLEYWRTRRAHRIKDLLRPDFKPPAEPID